MEKLHPDLRQQLNANSLALSLNSNIISDNMISGSIWCCGIVLCGHSSKNTAIRNTTKDRHLEYHS